MLEQDSHNVVRHGIHTRLLQGAALPDAEHTYQPPSNSEQKKSVILRVLTTYLYSYYSKSDLSEKSKSGPIGPTYPVTQ